MTVTSSFREALLHVARNLPMAPLILGRLGHLLLDPNSDLADVVALVKLDPALTARMIRLSNSVVFGAGRSVGTLEEALSRVGYNEVYRLVGMAAVLELADQPIPFYGITPAEFREHSLLTAMIIERLAVEAGTRPGESYTTGLLRSVGKIAMAQLAPPAARREPYRRGQHGSVADWERHHFGFTNAEAGALALEHWRFPAATVAAVSDHYVAGPWAGVMANLLNLAAGAADRCSHGLAGEDFYWTLTPEKLGAAGIDEAILATATQDALEQFGPIRAAVA